MKDQLQASTIESAHGQSLPMTEEWPTLALLSRHYIDRVLQHTGGNKTRAAVVLGIDRRTLNRMFARERAAKATSASR